MNFEDQILFFFSAIGAFNGIILSVFFAFFIKNKGRTTYFLAALIFVLSIRIAKSVFFTFYSDTSSLFIQIGLTAAFLIGPFLYLYTKATLNTSGSSKMKWLFHIIPIVLFMIVIGLLYPYNTHSHLWQHMSGGILGVLLFIQWLIYTLAALYAARFSFLKLFSKNDTPGSLDYWIINIASGCSLIWLAYITNNFTSYLVGALSFSFIIYITLMIWFFKRKKKGLSFLTPELKYGNKSIDEEELVAITNRLKLLFLDEKTHLKPNLKLRDLASKLQVKPYILSQYLNDNVGQSFSNYVNKHRVEVAIEMLKTNKTLTIEAIGRECGFKSKTSFYAAFKKEKGMTPSQFQKSLY